MASNPYATPESDVSYHSGEVIPTSVFTKRGRLSFMSFLGHSMVLALVTTLALAILFGIVALIGGTSFDAEALSAPSPLLIIPGLIAYAVMFWVAMCQMIKRLHDINFNGWWIISVFLVVGIILLLIPGKEVPNRFGAWRKTRTWEKVLGVLYILFIVLTIVGSIGAVGYVASTGAG